MKRFDLIYILVALLITLLPLTSSLGASRNSTAIALAAPPDNEQVAQVVDDSTNPFDPAAANAYESGLREWINMGRTPEEAEEIQLFGRSILKADTQADGTSPEPTDLIDLANPVGKRWGPSYDESHPEFYPGFVETSRPTEFQFDLTKLVGATWGPSYNE